MTQKKSLLKRIYMDLILLFLYAPLGVMVLFSFNTRNSTAKFGGLSLRWYAELFNKTDAVRALQNTLILALLASALAVAFGTAAAIGLDAMRRKWVRNAVLAATNLPMVNPEIVTGISLMLLFVFAGGLFGVRGVLGFPTMLLSHVTFCLPYVILSVLPKLRQCDPHLAQAAQDLGCSTAQAYVKVILPNILTGIVSGFLMALTLSLDDFVVSYFVSGPGFQTLPVYIYSMTRKKITPDMYALSTLMFASIFLLLLASNLVQQRAERKKRKRCA
jgi:spermidine/putrescine transport system permease protein